SAIPAGNTKSSPSLISTKVPLIGAQLNAVDQRGSPFSNGFWRFTGTAAPVQTRTANNVRDSSSSISGRKNLFRRAGCFVEAALAILFHSPCEGVTCGG